MASQPMPPNVHISNHPCLRAKLSQLRSHTTGPKETNALVHEIALMVGYEALAHGLKTVPSGTDESPLGYEYAQEAITTNLTLVPILRSGLAMVDAIQTLLPFSASIHHLGLFREPTTLQPVEYYNNLPHTRPLSSSGAHAHTHQHNTTVPDLAIILDPVIATGGTSSAAIQTLKDWGAKRVIVISVLGSEGGVKRASEEWAEGVEIWLGGLDKQCDARGMIMPGLGDIGDRLFLTLGK